jgi:spermidine synthase
MSKPWITLDTANTPDGTLTLRQHDETEYVIQINGRVLMSSRSHASEHALGVLACNGLTHATAPKVLLGGLGMAFTLRAMLDVLPATAHVAVAELNPVVVSWCRGLIASITHHAVDDPRVTVTITDFAHAVRDAAKIPGSLDAIAIDLYVGPDCDSRPKDPLYGEGATRAAWTALKPGGVFTVWGETLHDSYLRRLKSAGFDAKAERPARGQARYVVYVARKRLFGFVVGLAKTIALAQFAKVIPCESRCVGTTGDVAIVRNQKSTEVGWFK